MLLWHLKVVISLSLAAGYTDMNLNPSREPLSCWLDFIMAEGAVKLAGEEKSSRVLPSTGPCTP